MIRGFLTPGREGELTQRVEQLTVSRGAAVEGAATELQRIERDLHDGAQQRLTAIQIKLELLRERSDARALASELDEIVDDASAAVEDLRSLAHGIYPTVLLERGLAHGVRSLAKTLPMKVEVIDRGIERCSSPVEGTAYFCLLEAIQNAMKHAGLGARVTVTLDRIEEDVLFEVADDGPGFRPDDASAGIGLTSMRDSVGAVGGEIEIVSSPHAGTRIRGSIPDDTVAQAVPGFSLLG
jgi:signal transduction histidine kinase